ncbi:hypothetical protein B0H16DRAFT_1608910 [Mycena metata]|uniref:F-box domain-containing protein n=1 Tax=Mycena metata TaxID=1033252 RepID=A0AAD7MJ39_9AGAR|nr:hypothetical protein B0H16DRAFT_1608910 [Mycena metata]
MHRCLRVRELVELIFSNCRANPFLGPDKKVLARLGRTCKIFYNPALMNLLWRELDSLVPVLRCMPPDLFKVSPGAGGLSTVTLRRPIVISDWKRLLIYIPRVKTFTFSSFRLSLSAIFPALAQCLQRNSFFPRLTTLHWSTDKDTDFPYIRLFLAPTITSLRVMGMPPGQAPALFTALSRCTLKKVEIRLDDRDDASQNDADTLEGMDDSFIRAWSTFVCQLRAVERLQMLLPDAASFEHLGRLTTLRDLSLDELPARVLPRAVGRPSLFTNLTQLRLAELDFQPVITFLETCTDAAFESISFSFTKCPQDEPTGRICVALSHLRRSHATLRRLELSYTDNRERKRDRPLLVIRGHRIQPLFSFRNLTKLEILSPYGFDLSDTICDQMAHAWSHIKVLKLTEYFCPAKQPATVASLLSFAQNCPGLTQLHLTFDARVVPPPQQDINIEQVSQTALEHLYAGFSLTHPFDPHPLSTFLGTTFPKLTYISTAQNDYYKYRFAAEDVEVTDWFAWRKVEELLPGRMEMQRRCREAAESCAPRVEGARGE